MSNSVRVSPKHGVNPSVGVCWYCGSDDGTVALVGRMSGDAEAPGRGVYSMEPCAECKRLMEKGVMLISVRDGEESQSNPYRTGRMAVVKVEAIRRMLMPEAAEAVARQRVGFVSDSMWTQLGLPMTDKEEEP